MQKLRLREVKYVVAKAIAVMGPNLHGVDPGSREL